MGNKIDITPYVVPKVAKAVLSESKITFIYGWRDGGKSTSAFNVLIWKCLLDSHFRYAHCRAKYNEIAGSTFQTLKDCITRMGLSRYFTITKDRFQIINKLNPNNYFFGASADQPDKIRSTANLSGFIVDEAHDLTENDFSSLLGTLRENKELDIKTKAIFIFNNDKVREDGFIAKTFFDKNSPIYNDIERVLVSHLDNPFINIEETEKKLKLTCLGDMDKYNMLLSGKFIQEKNDNPFIYVDWRKRLVDYKLEFKPEYPIIVSIDFNNDPMTCTVWQFTDGIHPLDGGNEHFIHCIAEFETSTKEAQEEVIGLLGKKVKAAYPYSFMWITGDASGKFALKGAPQNKSGYFIFCDAVKMPYSNIRVRGANMTHTMSRSLLNTIYYNHSNLRISKHNTPNMIRDIEMAKIDVDGKPDELYKDRESYKMDYFDNMQYVFQNFFSYYYKK